MQETNWWDAMNAETPDPSEGWDAGTYDEPGNAPPGGGAYPYDDQFAKIVTEYYQKYLGRTPSSEEILSHWGNPGGPPAVTKLIQESQEAKDYKAKQNQGGGGNTDPVKQAVLDAFKKKGLNPRDDADLNYWINKINSTGGFENAQNKQYWLDRMAMQYGGVGDYTESGKVGYDGNYRMEGGPTNLSQFGQSGVWADEYDFPAFAPPDWNAPEFERPGPWTAPTLKDLPTFDAPTFTEPGAFEAPTMETVTGDAGFQARLKMGTDALQRSAAARGTLLTTGTVQNLQQFSQDYASNEYNQAYGRAKTTYDTNYQKAMDAYKANYGEAWDEYQALYNKLNAENEQGYSRSRDEYNSRYGAAMDAYNARYNQSRDAYNAQRDRYNQLYTAWLNKDSAAFDRLYKLYALGAGLAQGTGVNA